MTNPTCLKCGANLIHTGYSGTGEIEFHLCHNCNTAYTTKNGVRYESTSMKVEDSLAHQG